MNTRVTLLSITTFFLLLFTACTGEAQTNDQVAAASTDAKIEVIQFHSEHRCMTCNKIEELTRETLKNYPNIEFSLVNVDDAKNERISEEFEAFGTSLYLHNPASGQRKDLTEFAFMNAGDEEKFMEGLKEEISGFGD